MRDKEKNKGKIKYHVTIKELIRSLRIRHILMFLLLPVFLCIIILLNFRMVYRLTADNIEYGGEYRVKSYSVAYEDYLKPGLQLMEYVAYNVEHMFKTGASNAEILEFFGHESDSYAREVNAETTGVYGYIKGEYLDGSGWVPDEDYVPTQRPWYVETIKSEEVVSYIAPYVDEETGDVIMTIARRLSDGVSVVAIDIKMNEIGDITKDLILQDAGEDAIMVLDEDGAVVTHSENAQTGLNYFETKDEPARSIAVKALEEKADRFDISYGGNDDVFYSRPIGGGWYVISQTSRREAFSKVFEAIRGSLVVAVLGTFIIFAVLIFMTLRRMEADNLTANLRTVAGIYVCMFKINLITDSYEEISCRSADLAAMITGSRENARMTLHELIAALTDERSREDVLEFTDLNTLNNRMKNSDILTAEFMNHKALWCRGRFVASERDRDGNLISVIWLIENIDEEKRARDRLQYLSETDSMTGINNRGCGENKIRKMLINGDGGMFILLDIDKFKSFNDNYGHDIGDKVLISVADCMKRAFRDNDIIMRLGGDEFAAFIPNVFSREGGGNIIIDRFLECVRSIRIKELEDVRIDISVGAAFYRVGDRYTFDELYKRADKCTYESKSKPGTQVTYYDERDV
ncbi:MAG: diguanylate cyclase [Lachnospiraceae bacterium]|nr:diguanylate cyclase [Lachnospiraceae bacterium]